MRKPLKWFITAALFGLICFGPVFAVTNNLETSVVSMIVKSNQMVIAKDDFFELIDFYEYQLIPLNSLSFWLELDLDFNREKNMLKVYSHRFNRVVQVYINEQQYIVEGKSEWRNQPPVVLDGNFYVSTLLVEYVAQVKVIWISRYQELTIQGDWISPKVAGSLKSNTKTKIDKQSDEKPLEGPTFSLGAIEYELSWENRQGSSGNETINQVLGIRSHGRAGPWTISAGGAFGYDYSSQNIDPALTMIRAEYNENNQLIVLGDSEVNLAETLGTKELRGIVWMTPNQQVSKNLLFTTISGMADPGDRIKLLVNDQLTGELTVHEGNSYVFTNVPLKLRRVNVIKIVITKENGETIETCKRVAACPRMMERGTYDYLLTSGSYRQALMNSWGNDLANDGWRNNTSISSWEGNVTAFKAGYGINDRITLSSEAARIKPVNLYDRDTKIINGADLGAAIRIGEDTVYTLDWLIGGEDNRLENGWSSSVLYEMENGCFEAGLFYAPDEVTKGLRNVIEGRGVRVLGELECARNVDCKVNGNLVESMANPGDSYREINLMLNQHSGVESQIDNSLFITQKNINTLSQTRDLAEITFEHWRRGAEFSTKERLGFSALDFKDSICLKGIKSLSFEANVIKSFDNSLLFGFTFNPAINWWDNQYHDITGFTQLELKWCGQKLWASLKGSTTGAVMTGSVSGFQMNAFDLSGNFKYYLNQSSNCYLKFNRVLQNLDGDTYTTGEAGFFSHQWPKNDGKAWVHTGYVAPPNGQSEPQWSYSLGISKVLKPGFEIMLETEKKYDSLWSNSYDLVYRLSFRQALGFGNGRMRAFPCSKVENSSIICGTVYLDENGNGKRDPAEKGLTNIKMKLDGCVVGTDEEGDYLFNPVEPGIYRLNLDLKSLPADYTPVTGEQLVKIKPSENLFLDFGVTMNGSISGKVFIDANANGRIDAGEEPLPWVGILLNSAKKYFLVINLIQESLYKNVCSW